MRENRQSGSEGGGTETNRFSLPLSKGKTQLFLGKPPSPGGGVSASRAVT